MRYYRHASLIQLLAVLVLFFMRTECAHANKILVGAAEVDITPPVGFRCGGSYQEVISTGVHDPLFAKALVVRQNNMAAAIVISDLLSVPPDLSRMARDQASEKTGIPPENIVIAATHNHGSPEYWGSLRDIAHSAAMQRHGHDPHETVDYQARLVNAWVEAISKADRMSQPATIGMVVAQQTGLAFNRRFHMQHGSVRFNPGVGNPAIVRPAGPVDTDLPFILFRSVDNQRTTIASLTTFAMHTAVHGGTEFSGDFPAVMQTELCKALGNRFVSLFAEGTAGDINHINVNSPNQTKGRPEVERIGKTLSATILDSLDDMKAVAAPDLAVVSHTAYAPFKSVGKARYAEAIHQLREQKTLRLPFLTVVAAWRDCHRYRYSLLHDSNKPLEVQAIRLDANTAIVTLPHEVFVELGLAIKATSPFRNTIVISLANDIDYYIPTRRAFEEGSYEVTTCPLEPGCGEILLQTAQAALKELKHRPTNTR